MKKFEKPVIEIVVFKDIDIVTTSLPDVDDNGFNNEVVKP